jgi:2-oxoisovalerate dehydrogenase E1 component
VVIADETRRTGGVSEGVLAILADDRFGGWVRRVTAEDSFVPLGDAADTVLLSQQSIEVAGRALMH